MKKFNVLMLLCALSSFLVSEMKQGELLFIENIHNYLHVPADVSKKMYASAGKTRPTSKKVKVASHIYKKRPLFKAFPLLRSKISLVELADLPTPVHQLPQISKKIGVQLYIKRDDLTGKILENGTRLFGGNKMRKLEFLLAQALQEGATSVIGMGCVGSNLIVALAACCNYLGLRMIAMLKPQPNAPIVRRNLLLMDYYGAELHLSHNTKAREADTINQFLQEKFDHGRFPYFVPIGASTPLSILGYINAAYELKEQIKQGLLPEPDRIYVAAGQSVGTYMGLLIGAKAAGLNSKIIAVAVEPNVGGLYEKESKKLFDATMAFLEQLDIGFPTILLDKSDFCIIHNACGAEYARCTPQATKAIDLMQICEGLELDGVYTGKAFWGLIYDVKKNACKNDVILFWNTFYSEDQAAVLKNRDYKKLPKEFHQFLSVMVNDNPQAVK